MGKYHIYFLYITTNPRKKVLYTGVTNDIRIRLQEHYQDSQRERKSFAGKYFCYNLIYLECYQWVQAAIQREKEIKGWKRFKKEELINSVNPEWRFMNDEIQGLDYRGFVRNELPFLPWKR